MKSTIIKICVCIITFFVSIAFIGAISNKGNADMTIEMPPAELPLVYVVKNAQRINCMHGYSREMSESYMRDVITPIENDRKINFYVDSFGTEMGEISFELRSIDGKRLIENTKLSKLGETEDGFEFQIVLKDLIEPQVEYNLAVIISGENEEKTYYYTRIIQSEELYLEEKLQFAKQFHESTFTRNEEIAKYLESNSEGDNTTLQKVTIHSSFSQITWANLSVMKDGQPRISITEVGPQTASFLFDYSVLIGEKKYRVQEYYRVRYGTERMYLLDFERSMNQYSVMDLSIFSSSKILLGITDLKMEKKESEDGNILAFVQENALYSFNMTENKFVLLFAFYDKENWDQRTLFYNHNIKILSVEETGNVRFMVYGYMNRGRHEGQVGIQVYYFNSLTNTIEEDIYIPYDKSYELLSKEISNLAFVSKENKLYLLLHGSLFEINLIEKKSEIIATGLKEDSYKVSNDNKMIVWQSEIEKKENKELVLLNLNTKEENRTTVQNNQRIAPIGFMGDDLIYGVAETGDIILEKTGETIFPMYMVVIQNEQGDVLKKYQQESTYVVEGIINGNLLTLKRIIKQEQETESEIEMTYVAVDDDQILNAEIVESTQNSLETVVTEEFEMTVQVVLKKTVTPDTIKFLMPKEVLFEGGREVVLQEPENKYKRYYVHDKYGIDSITTIPAKAVKTAAEIAAVVLDDKGEYIWKPSNRMTKNQIMKIKEAAVGDGQSSVSVCLDAIMSLEGVPKDSSSLLMRGESITKILEENLKNTQILNLSGCTLDSVLYYVNKDIPVLALLKNGTAVLVIGFNELNIVIMDPTAGTIYKMGMKDSTQWFEENGNNFITYMKNNE